MARVARRVNDGAASAAPLAALPSLRGAVYLSATSPAPVKSLSPSAPPLASYRAALLAALVALAATGCGGRPANSVVVDASSPAQQASEPRAQGAPPGSLSRFASLKVMLLPLQGVRTEAVPAWQQEAGAAGALARSADLAFEAALGERGLATLWVFPASMERAARRNPTYITDPYQLRAGMAVRAAMRKPTDPLAEPFASQLRALAGVSDSRYAVLPLELRFEPTPSGNAGRPRLQVAAIDARGAQVVWVGEVIGAESPAYSAAVLSDLAVRLADLVVPR